MREYIFEINGDDISVSHDADASYKVTGITMLGTINHRVGPKLRVETSENGSIVSIKGTRLDGKAQLDMTSLIGNITIRLVPD